MGAAVNCLGSGAVGELSIAAQRILVHTQFTKYATDFIPVDMSAAKRALGSLGN